MNDNKTDNAEALRTIAMVAARQKSRVEEIDPNHPAVDLLDRAFDLLMATAEEQGA